MTEKFKIIIFKLINYIKCEYKYLICLILITIICFTKVNYYIIVGGGISDIDKRVKVSSGYNSSGSFNLSYVSEVDGFVLSYLLSYVIPNWKRVSVDDYKYDTSDSVEDILFRNQLSLDIASSNATKIAYARAEKDIELKDEKTYVISISHDFLDLELQVGDEIVDFNGQKLSHEEYRDYIANLEEGDIINVRIIRDGKEKVIKAKVYMIEDRKMIGVYLATVDYYKTNPKTTIKFKSSESGPSAGLMTALEIYNQLVKEDITKGLKIAGTGTIDSNGNVGEIGEVKYKLLGAVSGHADVFIVPMGDNYEEVKKIVQKEKLDIKVIGVSTFDEALEALSKLK